jgi:hypothetical protein
VRLSCSFIDRSKFTVLDHYLFWQQHQPGRAVTPISTGLRLAGLGRVAAVCPATDLLLIAIAAFVHCSDVAAQAIGGDGSDRTVAL